jgi:hypothetical protein
MLIVSRLIIISLLLASCSSPKADPDISDLLEVKTIVSLMEYDLKGLENEIKSLADYAVQLFQESETTPIPAVGYTFYNNIANNAPNADTGKSTIWISNICPDFKAANNLVALTNPIDDEFKKLMNRNEVIEQVYYNSSLQVNRLYPPFDAATMFEADLDVTTFNFYYMADNQHNPSKGPVWLSDIYIDPVGKGWMISLLHPVYYNDSLSFVLGIDLTVNVIIDNYLNRSSKNLIIVDETGTVVAGKSQAIEALYLPPLKNHTYLQTITADNYRMEDFNLFKSKSQSVRRMASNFLLEKNDSYTINEGMVSIQVFGTRMNMLPWYVLELKFQ